MSSEQADTDLRALFDGLKIDAASYFKKAQEALAAVVTNDPFAQLTPVERDRFWASLPDELRSEAKRLDLRLVTLMGQVARAIRSAPLASEADQRDAMTGTKTMRAAIRLRHFRSWNTDILHDEDIVLGVTPAGQSDNEPSSPEDAGQVFADWAEKIVTILDLVAASPGSGQGERFDPSDTTWYRPGTAFVMMWMDKSHPELTDLADVVKGVFAQFDIRAVRADDIEHEGLITPRILNEIKTAEFRFADLTGERPNVYYEVGYAHALPRRVILISKSRHEPAFRPRGLQLPGV